MKDITAAGEYHADVAVALGLPAAVSIVNQGEMILADRNAFWIHVINVGRALRLQQMATAAALESATASDDSTYQAGQVIAVLMTVADAAILGATHVCDGPTLRGMSRLTGGSAADVLCDSAMPPQHADDWLFSDERRAAQGQARGLRSGQSPYSDCGLP